MEVLERAQMQMQQAQRNIAEGNQATEDQEGIADQSARNSMDDLGRARPEEAGQEGQESASPSNSMNEAEGQNATPSDAFGQGPTSAQNERDDGKGKPKEEGYEDSQLFGMNGPAEADEKWVRQLPTLNAREIRPDGSLQDFQQAAVRAQGGSAIPRAYRAVVRSYFMHLERLNIDQELGLPEPPPVEQDITPVEVPPDPGGTFGPEYEGNAEAPPVIDGGRGPDR
jgi:hypothetical protein